MSNALQREQAATQAVVELASVIETFPGPACLIGADRRPVLANALWHQIGLAAPGDNRYLPGNLAAGLLAVRHTGRPQRVTVSVANDGERPITLDVTCLPCSVDGEAATIAFAADCTPSEDLRDALVQSRDFHRDMALCATDTTFEVDVAGRFTYVGQGGFLGLTDNELVGTRIADFIHERSRHAAELALTAREPIDGAEFWFTAASGAEACFIISATPVFDQTGEWAGLRGFGREVTEERERDEEIDAVRRGRRRIDAIVHAMHCEVRPSMIIRAGAATVLDTVELCGCAVVHASNGRFDRIEAFAKVDSDFDAGRCTIDERTILDLCQRCADTFDGALRTDRINGDDVLIAVTRHAGSVNGAVVFFRAMSEDSVTGPVHWSDDDRHLLRAVAGHMSTAIAQLDLFDNPFASAPA